MNILFLEPTTTQKTNYSFPNILEDKPKVTFEEWVAFAKSKGLDQIKYFSKWDDLKKESNKNKLSPVVICQDYWLSEGQCFRGMKKKGVRVFGINNYDYSRMFMASNYVIPIKCDTCEQLYIALHTIITEGRFTKGVIKGEVLDFRSGALVEAKLPW